MLQVKMHFTESMPIMKAASHNVLACSPTLTSAAVAASYLDHLKALEGLECAADRPLSVRVQVFDRRGVRAGNRLIEVFDPARKHQSIVSGMTDEYGRFEADVRLPNHLDQVVVRANVLGIDNEALVGVLDGVAEQVLL